METYELLFINKYGIDIFGDVKGKTCWKTLQNDQTGPCEFCTNKFLVSAKGKPTGIYTWEHQNTSNNKWYECRDQAIYWFDNHLVLMEIATDITQRKLQEKELISQAAIWSSLMASVHEGIFEIDQSGNTTFFNTTALNLLGYSKESALKGKSIHALIQHKYANGKPYPVQSSQILNVLKTGKDIFIDEDIFWRADGQAIPVSYHATPVNESTGITGVVITFEDISERLKIRQQVQDKVQELEQFNKLAIGREIKMIELKKDINRLLKEQGKDNKFNLDELL
jgi:PAS domain S-box-containing protein